MPLYEVHHFVNLDRFQLDSLAEQITDLHATTFETPSLFVNVRFIYENPEISSPLYVGGKPRRANYILAHVRHGPARPRKQYDELALSLSKIWNSVTSQKLAENYEASESDKVTKQELPGEKERSLHLAFVLGEILAGYEGGFILPEAGQDRAWLKSSYMELANGAHRGDLDHQELLCESKARGWDFEE